MFSFREIVDLGRLQAYLTQPMSELKYEAGKKMSEFFCNGATEEEL